MREVDSDPELGAALDEPPAGGREARAGVRTRRELELHAAAEAVGAAPHRTEAPQPGRVPELERLQVLSDRLGALDVQDQAERAVLEAGIEVGGVADQARL